MTTLQIGDRVTFAIGAAAPGIIEGDEVGTVLHIYATPGDQPDLVDVRFPSVHEMVARRPETDFALVQHHGGGGPA